MAAKGAATDATLGALHSKVAKVMTDALTVVEKAQERYIETEDSVELPPQVSAPLLGVITKFLSDNSITCAVEDSEELQGLAATLEAKRKARGVRVGNVLPFVQEA